VCDCEGKRKKGRKRGEEEEEEDETEEFFAVHAILFLFTLFVAGAILIYDPKGSSMETLESQIESGLASQTLASGGRGN
jgi:hypothetical protein